MLNTTVKSAEVQRILLNIGSSLDILDRKYGMSVDQVIKSVKLAKSCAGIPISIFNSRLGALESIVKYVREELNLDYLTIAKMLNRNEGPIGVTYRRAEKKFKGSLDISSREFIPYSVFGNSRLSVFESLAVYLKAQDYDWHEIAHILHRDDKTVWTVLDRAKKKMRVK